MFHTVALVSDSQKLVVERIEQSRSQRSSGNFF